MLARIQLTRGVTRILVIDLVDEHGHPITSDRLEGATGVFTMRVTAEGADVLVYDGAISLLESTLEITIAAADTTPLALGPYLYQVITTLTDGTVLETAEWSPIDIVLGGSATPTPPTFDNTIKLDHDFPLDGDLAYKTAGGSPIPDAQVRVYYKSHYDAGDLASPVGVTTTDADGKWTQPVLVVPGYDYVVRFEKPYEYGPDVKTVTAV